MSGVLDRLFAPVWAGPWAAFRVAFALTAALTLGPRYWGIGDVYGVQDMVFSERPFNLADHVIFTESTATILWAVGMASLALVAWGGRLTKPALLLFLVADWLLLANETLNIKAYDRLQVWMVLALLLGPTSQRGLQHKWRSPLGRYFLLVAFCGIYGSTGWLKATKELEGWLSGEVLAFHLVHQHFGLRDLGVWLSDKPLILAPFSWATVIFEAGFPLLIWFRRTNPWVLVVGLGMHIGIFMMMNVGPFSFVALSAYPVLLHPESARRLYERAAANAQALRSSS